MKICLFEDKFYNNFYPLTYLRPVWDLVCGFKTIKGNLEDLFQTKIRHFYSVRKSILPPQEIKGEFLFINGRIAADRDFAKVLKRKDRVFISERGKIVAFKGTLEEFLQALENPLIKACRINTPYIWHPWDLLKNLKIQETKTKIESGAKVSKLAVLDESNGPIFIGKNTVVHPFTILKGPLYIGENCRIGGEVSSSIIMDNVNKAHFGFLGDSYLCPWVNLGAGTTNSNLKNNYSSVKVFSGGKKHDTRETFMGCFVGDHAKTAIGTLIYTGCVIGIFANIFGEHHVKNFVPSFSWGKKGEFEINKAIECARAVMKRRGVEAAEAYTKMITEAFEITKTERVHPNEKNGA